MVQFWNVLYDKVLLEYMYVNKLNWAVPKLEVMRDDCNLTASEDASRANNSVSAHEQHEMSKANYNITSYSNSFGFDGESSSASLSDEVKAEASREQMVPLGGTYEQDVIL